MDGPPGNPFEAPSPPAGLPLPLDDDENGGDPGSAVSSVTFRVTYDDLRRAASGGITPAALLGFVLVLAMAGVGLAGLPTLREEGLSADVLRLIAVSALPIVAILGAAGFVVLRGRFGPKGSAEAPFATTVTLTPSGLSIREQGIAELRRSWSSVSGVVHDPHQIRFEFLMFNASTGRFEAQPGQVVPLRAFESEADAASFLRLARGRIAAADRLPALDGTLRRGGAASEK